ncbi:MAG TPA: surface lipoprotein assembly modifier [Caulobacteraceae bacterium]
MTSCGRRGWQRTTPWWRWLAVALVIWPAVAAAQGPPPSPPPTPSKTIHISDVQAVQLLLESGRVAEAKALLARVKPTPAQQPEVDFLLGLIAEEEKDYATAVREFRKVLVATPGAERARLELARAFYLKKDFDNAERQFRLARAGDLPPGVAANIDRYLYLIRQARRWSYNVSVSAAPDTDINAGPSTDIIDILGLPFQLAEQARKHSGVGVALDASGEWSPKLNDTTQMRIGGQIDSHDYSQGVFDDTSIAAYAGPRFISRRWDVSPLLTGFYRWYGNVFYNGGVGGAVQATYYPSQRLALTGSVGGQEVYYAKALAQTGPAINGSLTAYYTLAPTSVVSAGLAAFSQFAETRADGDTAVTIQAGYSRDLPKGFTVSVQPSFTWIGYAAPLVLFAKTRQDHQWQVQLTVLNRRIDIGGFTPRIAYYYTDNESNLPLFAYRRNRVELGFTRLF